MKAGDRRDIQKPGSARGTVPMLIAYDAKGAPSRPLLATRKEALPLPGVPDKVVVRTRGRVAQAHADIQALRAALLGEQLATPRDGAEPEVWPPEPDPWPPRPGVGLILFIAFFVLACAALCAVPVWASGP
jgi:hypothetical protein